MIKQDKNLKLSRISALKPFKNIDNDSLPITNKKLFKGKTVSRVNQNESHIQSNKKNNMQLQGLKNIQQYRVSILSSINESKLDCLIADINKTSKSRQYITPQSVTDTINSISNLSKVDVIAKNVNFAKDNQPEIYDNKLLLNLKDNETNIKLGSVTVLAETDAERIARNDLTTFFENLIIKSETPKSFAVIFQELKKAQQESKLTDVQYNKLKKIISNKVLQILQDKIKFISPQDKTDQGRADYLEQCLKILQNNDVEIFKTLERDIKDTITTLQSKNKPVTVLKKEGTPLSKVQQRYPLRKSTGLEKPHLTEQQQLKEFKKKQQILKNIERDELKQEQQEQNRIQAFKKRQQTQKAQAKKLEAQQQQDKKNQEINKQNKIRALEKKQRQPTATMTRRTKK